MKYNQRQIIARYLLGLHAWHKHVEPSTLGLNKWAFQSTNGSKSFFQKRAEVMKVYLADFGSGQRASLQQCLGMYLTLAMCLT